MKVVKSLNNSLVLATDQWHHEVIVMGKGLGFNAKRGDQIPEARIEKIFQVNESRLSANIMELAKSLEGTYFDLVQGIIAHGQAHYGLVLSDFLYLTLTDHMAYVAERLRQGIYVPLVAGTENRVRYPDQYALASYARQQLADMLGTAIPEEEEEALALHIINASQGQDPFARELRIHEETEALLTIIRHTFHLVYDKSSITYLRAQSHIQLFVQRLLEGQLLPDEQNLFLYQHIIETCPEEVACVRKMQDYLTTRYQIPLSNQEEMYLVLHIHRLIQTMRT